MVFSSLSFLILFLPSVIVLYYVCPKKYRSLRNAWLFLASLIFYGFGEPRFCPVFVCGILWNYLFGLLIGKCREETGSSARKKSACISALRETSGFSPYLNTRISSFQMSAC